MVARIEMAHSKLAFRETWNAGKRCLVQADGSYERMGQRPPTQWWLSRGERGPLFANAALGQQWRVRAVAEARVHAA